MAEIIHPESIAPTIPADDYFSPEARRLCARVKHKSELSDDETLMLAMAAAQAALARYWHRASDQPRRHSIQSVRSSIRRMSWAHSSARYSLNKTRRVRSGSG
jgi:hypothetical protein